MPTPYTDGSIAGNELTNGGDPLMVELVGASRLKTTIIPRPKIAWGGKVKMTAFVVGRKGKRFGVKVNQCPQALLDTIIADVETALLAGDPVPVILSNNTDNFSVTAWPDGADWVTYPGGRTNAENQEAVVFNFISDDDFEVEEEP